MPKRQRVSSAAVEQSDSASVRIGRARPAMRWLCFPEPDRDVEVLATTSAGT